MGSNPNPTPRLGNLRPPWAPGTSGNPFGYSQGRRISDAIERYIDEHGLEGTFAETAIAKALGMNHALKQKIIDPETNEETWVELKPDLGWFKLIVQRLEPVTNQKQTEAQKREAAAYRLAAILDYNERERAEKEQAKAAGCAERLPSDPGAGIVGAGAAGTLFQGLPAGAGSGQAALEVPQTALHAADLVPTLAVQRPSDQRLVPVARHLLELFNPARRAVQLLALLPARLAGLFTGDIRRLVPGDFRIRPGLAGGPGRALAEIAFVVGFLLYHQAVVLDYQRAGGHDVPSGAVAANEHHRSLVVRRQQFEPLQVLDIEFMGRLVPDRLARDRVAVEQVVARPRTMLTRSTFPVHYPVLAPERPTAGDPPPRAGT